jgi:signal transduction histidine kinase
MAPEPRVSTVLAADGQPVEHIPDMHEQPTDASRAGSPEMEGCVSEVRALFPAACFGVRFLLADRRGHLRVALSQGVPLDLGRRQTDSRRLTFADSITRILEGPDGLGVGIFPIDRRGHALGVAEISTSVGSLPRRRSQVEAALGRVSARLRHGVERWDLDVGLAWTAHELLGPLRAVTLYLENAQASGGYVGAVPLGRAIEELSRLADGIDSVLHWAVGDETLEYRREDLVALTHEAVDCCAAEAGQDRVIIEGDDRLDVVADPLHLRSAIMNIVRNALRYSSTGTKVHVTVELRDGGPTVEVENEGPGIPEEERRTIFEPLAHGAREGGSGLGLFVAARVVERHGGTIRCHEPAEGRVAFELRLPPGARP